MAGAHRELVALGGHLDVPTLVAAYRAGCFPSVAVKGHSLGELTDNGSREVRRGMLPIRPTRPWRHAVREVLAWPRTA